MIYSRITGMLIGCATTLLVASAGAQQAAAPAAAAGGEPAAPPSDVHNHDGFYLNLGLNFGYSMVSWSVDGAGSLDQDLSGLSSGFDLLIGGTPVPGLVIGGGLIGVRTSDPKIKTGSVETTADGTMLLAGLSLFGQYYFDPAEGFFLQGQLGYAVLDFVNSNGSSGGNDPTGFLVGVGAGYDFWIGEQWSVGPVARFLYASTSVEAGAAKATQSYLYPSLGVAFTLH
ncbi:MAG: autotransporter domain-containing protein [Polyangiaceae bacterium]